MKIKHAKFKVSWKGEGMRKALISIDAYTIPEFIEGAELEFPDGSTLPMDDITWGEDKVEFIPQEQ